MSASSAERRGVGHGWRVAGVRGLVVRRLRPDAYWGGCERGHDAVLYVRHIIRPLRLTSMPRLPQAIVPFDCSDKKIHETWTPKRARDLANLPSPFRALLIGPPGGGKSTVAVNLLIHQRRRFDELYVIHEDYREDGTGSTEYDHADPTVMLADVPPLEYWNEVCSGDDPDGPPVKRLIIIDDLEFTSANKERLRNIAILFRYVSTHKSMSVILAHQSFFDIPTLLKKTASIFIVWKPRATSEYALLDNRCGLPKGTLRMLFKDIATGERDSIMIDHTANSPAPLRLNIWQPISIDTD